MSDAAGAALFSAVGVVLAALFSGLFLLLSRIQGSMDTGNGHPIGKGVANVERDMKALGRLIVHHIAVADRYVAGNADPEDEMRRARFLEDSARFLEEFDDDREAN